MVESVIEPASPKEPVADAIRRIEDVATGHGQGLTEEQYGAASALACKA